MVVKDFYSVFKSYAYANEHWTVAISNEGGNAYTARCQGPLDSHLETHSLPEMVPDSEALLNNDTPADDTDTSRYIGMDKSRFLREQTSRLLEAQTSLLIDLLNFDPEACLMAERDEKEALNVAPSPETDVEIGPTLSEILCELGTSL